MALILIQLKIGFKKTLVSSKICTKCDLYPISRLQCQRSNNGHLQNLNCCSYLPQLYENQNGNESMKSLQNTSVRRLKKSRFVQVFVVDKIVLKSIFKS